jgi:hypothetical protein
VVGIIIAAWLVTAVVALSVAGIAKLTDHDETAAHAIGSLNWPAPFFENERKR